MGINISGVAPTPIIVQSLSLEAWDKGARKASNNETWLGMNYWLLSVDGLFLSRRVATGCAFENGISL